MIIAEEPYLSNISKNRFFFFYKKWIRFVPLKIQCLENIHKYLIDDEKAHIFPSILFIEKKIQLFTIYL